MSLPVYETNVPPEVVAEIRAAYVRGKVGFRALVKRFDVFTWDLKRIIHNLPPYENEHYIPPIIEEKKPSEPVAPETVEAIRKAAHEIKTLAYSDLKTKFPDVALSEIKKIIRNEAPYYDENYVSPVTSNHITPELAQEGWTIEKASWHFHRRLWKRYKIRLQFREQEQIIGRVKNHRAEIVHRGYKGTVYAISLRNYPDGPAFVVISNTDHGLITVLPRTTYYKSKQGWKRNGFPVNPSSQPAAANPRRSFDRQPS